MYPFEDLDVWKRSARLSADMYKAFTNLKDFGYRDQVTKASLSVPSNIAEGFERSSNKDRAKFLSYAMGSAGEIRTQIFIGMEVGYIDKDIGRQWLQETKEISKMLQSLVNKINKNN